MCFEITEFDNFGVEFQVKIFIIRNIYILICSHIKNISCNKILKNSIESSYSKF